MRSFFGVMVVALGSIAIACGGGTDGTVEAGNIIGQVSLVGGDELADADVTAGGLTTTTDTRGVFQLENVPAGTVNVLVTEPGYTRGHRRVLLENGESQNVAIKVMPKQTMTLDDAAAGGVVSGSDGVQLTLPANAFRDRSGNPVSGSVDVQYALLATSETIAAAPGGMLAAAGSEEVALESFGMVDVSFAKDDEPLTRS